MLEIKIHWNGYKWEAHGGSAIGFSFHSPWKAIGTLALMLGMISNTMEHDFCDEKCSHYSCLRDLLLDLDSSIV